MISFFKKNLFPLILISFSLLLFFLNFSPNTWLTGWDTLHPEFNFSLSIQRIFNGVWRYEQGLGAVAGHSHMADLPRILFLWPFSFIFPLSFLRYFYFLICLILGPLGVYFFLERIIFNKLPDLFKKNLAFLGGLFYLLNLGTIQHFYVPFEMFATQYAALGWFFLISTLFLKENKKRLLIYFALISFLSTSQAYAATLWYAFFACFLVYLLTYLFLQKKRLLYLKRIFLLVIILLVINSFWLLPNFYFITHQSGEVIQAKINRLFSEEAFLHNYEYGNIKNNVLLKNHLFSWTQYNFNTQSFDYLLKSWIEHLRNPFILSIGYLSFLIITLGIVGSLIKRDKKLIPLLPIFFIAFIFLISAVTPFKQIFFFLREKVPLFKEALRFPFTKFSIILMFSYAVFFAFGLGFIFNRFKKFFLKKKYVIYLITIIITIILIFFTLPAFKGQLINPRLKVKIPHPYFEMHKWFNNQEDKGRIVQLPLHTFWGWEYYKWGFQGAGFNWFGIKQPLLVRDFDRWNPKNEKAYQEISYALYGQNINLLEDLLQKYYIHWLLLDKNIIAPEENEKVLFFEETENLLSLSENIKLVKEFDNLKIYQININEEQKDYSVLIDFENPPQELKEEALKESKKVGKINQDNFNLDIKREYQLNINDLKLQLSLCSQPQEKQVFALKEVKKDSFTLYGKNSIVCSKIPLKSILDTKPFNDFLLKIEFLYEKDKPSFCLAKWGSDDCLLGKKEENSYLFQFPKNRKIENYELRFLLNAKDQEKETLIKNIKLTTFKATKELPQEKVDNIEISKKYNTLKAETRDSFSFPELSYQESYALIMEAENISGLPLRACLNNYNTKRCDLYFNLDNGKNIVFIPRINKEGQGYDINISNYGIGPLETINKLKSIKIIPFKYAFITKEKIDKNREIITNNQAFEKNWRAFAVKDNFRIKSLGKPFLYKGWVNGWENNQNAEGKIIFIFLPQILQYLGYFLILLLIVYLAFF